MIQGGKFIFVEHVAYQPIGVANKFWIVVQSLLGPLWQIVMCGCSLKKPTWSYIENAGFQTVTMTRGYPKNLPSVFRPHIWGCAIK